MRNLRLLQAPALPCLLLLAPGLVPATVSFASTVPQTAPALGAASRFVVLGGSTVTNTGLTIVNADLGVSPGTAVTGFAPGVLVGGTIHSADALAAQAQIDLTTAYNSLASQTCPSGNDLTGQDLGGKTLTPAVYCFSSSAQLTGAVTLDAQANPGAVFVFKIGSTLTTASGASVRLVNGASPANVFWQVGSSATLGTSTAFVGNVIALASITVTTGTVISGRALARTGAVTLDTNTVGLVGATPSAPPAAPIVLNPLLKIHPLLQYGALTNPAGVARVIVQQNGLLGGGATEHFTIIPALVTSIQLGSIAALALDPSVRYISPDGPVQIVPGVEPAAASASTQPQVMGSFSGSSSRTGVDSSQLSTTYPFDTGATRAWAGARAPRATAPASQWRCWTRVLTCFIPISVARWWA